MQRKDTIIVIIEDLIPLDIVRGCDQIHTMEAFTKDHKTLNLLI
jgi:hypothetical protein